VRAYRIDSYLTIIPLMTTPFCMTVVRTRKRRPRNSGSTDFWKFQRKYFGKESVRWFVIEWLLFALLAAASSWPILRAIEALHLL
jgi:hypothetical protein